MWQRLVYRLLRLSLFGVFGLFSLFSLLVGCANNNIQQPNIVTANYDRGTSGIIPAGNPAPNSNFDPISIYKGSYALLIGASEYRAGWPRLPGVKKDIPAVQQALEQHGFKVITVWDPNREQLLKAFENFINEYGLTKNNRLLFYFAGHGYTVNKTAGEMGYIVPVDAPNPLRDLKGFLKFGVDMEQIEGYAKRIDSKHALFIFDSCFSGSIFALSRDITPAHITYRIARPVRQFITSGSAEEKVPDQSVFREQFVLALNGEADVNNDGYITGSELGVFLQDTVINYSSSSQHPQYGKIRNSRLDKGDFVFQIAAAPDIPKSNTTASVASQNAKLRAELAEAKLQAKLAKAREQQALIEKAEAARKLAAEQRQREQAAHQARLQTEQARLAKLKQQREAEEARLADLERQRRLKAAEDAKRLAALRRQRQAEEARLERIRQQQAQQQVQQRRPSNSRVQARRKSFEPEMVSIPAGSFRMGDIQGGGDSDEKPVHEVYVKAFAISKYEITVGQFRSFVRDTNYRGSKVYSEWGCKGFMQPEFTQEDNHPVVCVTWHDALAYTKWLSRKTGKKYRLPTEAEWEYVARAGTSTKYWWGNEIGNNRANCRSCGDRYGYTSPVGSFAANPWGIYDTVGNVWEWTCSVYKDPYDGSEKKCLLSGASARVFRGGSWLHNAGHVRAANRRRYEPGNRLSYVGFRACEVQVK